MKDRELATRYAKALFELACKNESELKIEENLRMLHAQINSKKELSLFFQNPVLTFEEKKALLRSLAEKKIARLAFDFILVLIEKGRFSLLESILIAYHELLNASQHFEEVLITTAKPIRSELKTAIEKVLEEKIGERIVSETKVDPKLIGGVSIQIRNRLFDGSVAAKLDLLKKQMLGLK